MSSFKNVSVKEVDSLISRLNNIYDKGRQIGFKKIYLSIVPNPVSILEPKYDNLTYNNLVERLQHSSNLEMPYINLLPAFKQMKEQVYLSSDSHWNKKGAYVWLRMVNNELIKISKDDPPF
jgi:hypothetical protein